MGAQEFFTEAVGQTAREAFIEAKAQARDEYGYGGYTGTIAEKPSFRIVEGESSDPYSLAEELLRDDDHWVADKWGPAGCILMGCDDDINHYLFFGYASS